MELTDRQLAERVLEGADERAFGRLYDRHTPRLYRFVLRYVGGSDHEAEDVVQEAWLRAVRGLESFEWKSSLGTWLTSIALNVARVRHRRSGREEPMPPDPPTNPVPPLPNGVRIDLERALDQLPDGYRAVLLLHDLEGHTHREIGEVLGVTEGTSKSQLYHARQAMRAALRYEADQEATDG